MNGFGFWDGKRVVVTGHSGFVGANLVSALLHVGVAAVGYDRLQVSQSLRAMAAVPAHSIEGDVTALPHLYGFLDAWKPDVIFHLAGLGHIADCQSRPGEAFRINAGGTVNVLEAVRQARLDPIIVCASSNHTYIGGAKHKVTMGAPRKEGGYGLTEATPLQATDAYGASKVAADLAVRCYRESYGLRAAALRHVNCFGPADVHESHLVTGAIVSCLKGERPKLRSDGSAVKGYLHVDSVVDAYLTVAEHVDELPGHAVNVTDPDGEAPAISIVRAVMEIAGISGGPEILGTDLSQKGYEERLDSALLRSLGWNPRYTLRAGLEATYSWYKEHDGMGWAK